VEKATAEHPAHGAVYVVGRRKGETEFRFLRPFEGRLEPESAFEISRLRWV
jgi:hypothetical protein